MLERLFTSKNRVKIMQFLLFEKEFHLRGISRELKIPVSAVKREVDNLKFIGLLRLEENKVKINEKCNFIEDLKNIFVKTDAIVYPLREVLEDRKIKYAFLFGSFAKGEYEFESDVDLLVIGDVKLSEVIKLLVSVENEIKRNINPVVWDLKEFKEKQKGKFIKEIFSGKILMLKGDENELRGIVKG